MESYADGQEHESGTTGMHWAGLEGSEDRETFLSSWLAIQCSSVHGCVSGVLVLADSGRQGYLPVASWPESGGGDGERLADVLEQSLAEKEAMFVELAPSGESSRYGLAYPVIADGECLGAVAVEVAVAKEDLLRQAMESLKWGAIWIENYHRQRRNRDDGDALGRLKAAIDILAGVLAEDHFDGAAMAFVTALSTRLSCDRVSLGLIKKKYARVEALSHSAVVGSKMNLLRAIGAAMDEAVSQRAEITCPPLPGSSTFVIRDHEQLAQKHGSRAVMTVPLFAKGRYYGALTLERQKDNPFSEDERAYVKSVVALSGPALENKHHQDRPVIYSVIGSLKRQAARFFGAGYTGRKAALIAVVLLAAVLSFAGGDYRITADTVLEGAVQRSIVAPFDGFIREAPARAGDVVGLDELLCSLDDRDLRLERLQWLGRQNQYQRQLQEAIAQRNRAEANVIRAQLDQALAQLELAESKLDRVAIRAPFDGIVLSGDLSQRLGGAVRQGEELFQIAPLDAYRVILKVDESDIADVEEGQGGVLVLSALPAEKYAFTVEKITPLTTAGEGKNYFRVEATLDRISPALRPGMEGVGKIQVDQRLYVVIWMRPVIEWFRLKLWSWWP
ncbi:MAG: HlyD family efflux transporter periplasmic adaptor subunit [Syntrophales bacterium]|jgi:multidrug resistance efflux pump|nr:HlyD family efflux transporter periplasmic adaptor subunit [Syntrophales bacterium]MCK9528448.1 HlyD family efflux transporter periplasmic adaptor subunit [Syntrophales bacterium]MDX9922471.1 HlyD family efflux transporter periplasmic adaptor subunit [Syntrophales bacterium]